MFVFFDTIHITGGGKITYKLHHLGCLINNEDMCIIQRQSINENI